MNIFHSILFAQSFWTIEKEMENKHHVIMFDSLFDMFFFPSFSYCLFLSVSCFAWKRKKNYMHSNPMTLLTDWLSVGFRFYLQKALFRYSILFYWCWLNFIHIKKNWYWNELNWIEFKNKIIIQYIVDISVQSRSWLD